MGETGVLLDRLGRWLSVLVSAASLLATACAHHGPGAGGDAAKAHAASEDPLDEEFVGPLVPDPLEPMNRPIFDVNMSLDSHFVEPVARAYGELVPDPVKASVRGVFANLNSPVVFVNELLQLHPQRAGATLGRFVLNSTLGIAGLFDPAAELGWTEQHADFGQTLGRYGVGPGLYLVLPLVGPSTARDTIGSAIDLFLRLDTWILPLSSQVLLGGGAGITTRETRRDELAALKQSSIDFYAAVRSAYLQSREALIKEAREP